MNVVCILMAAGAAKRFGSNKLIALYKGVPLYARAMDAIPAELLSSVLVVSGCEDIIAEAEERGFTVLENDKPELGAARTIRMGLEKAEELGADAAMFMVADQPKLTKGSVQALVADYLVHPENIVLMAHDERRGNPAIFPKAFFDELCALEGDTGGSVVIRAHEDAIRLHQIADPSELADVDGEDDYRKLTTDN